MNQIYLSLQFENFLSDLYGKSNYHGTVGWTSFSSYKKHLLKITKSLKSAIDLNVQDIDAAHQNSLNNKLEMINHDISKAKSFEELGQFVVLRLFQLIFLLLGDIPKNWELQKKTNHTHFSLQRHRGIHFSQTLEQKFNSIIDNAPINELSQSKYSRQMLLNEFVSSHNRNMKKFLEWHKHNFPETHLKLI